MRKGGDYSGIAIPYSSPGSHHVREYGLRRNHPDFEAGAKGELRVKQKYLSPPGRGNMLYLPSGCDPVLLRIRDLSVILTEGEFKTLAFVATCGMECDGRTAIPPHWDRRRVTGGERLPKRPGWRDSD